MPEPLNATSPCAETRRRAAGLRRSGYLFDTRNDAELVPVPADVVTEIGPFLAPEGTRAVICWSETTLPVVAAVVLNFTVVAPVKFGPLVVAVVPTGPLAGVNPLTLGTAVGGAVTEKRGRARRGAARRGDRDR